ncbi:alpha/beta hydrolase [Kitasatospora sp. NPDC049258]|uniref:alpha/beta hydrolase n=1 Tax=Kitasatospora sp. NPDC049258 TaxID=3155394 RepID=UPI0034479E13
MSAAPAPTLAAAERWAPAPGTAVRGTVLLLPGRGEHPGLYGRFGRRLAFDGYQVQAPAEVRSLADTAHLAEQVATARQSPGPVVLAGSDTGALLALAAAAGAARPDAVLLVGAPDSRHPAGPGWSDELAARTSCPVHRGLLADDPAFRPGLLGVPVAAELAAAAEAAAPDLPVLVLHGSADPVVPAAAAHRLAARLRRAELVLVADGVHDVLNDAAHRSVAAQVVQWLERLRAGGADLPELADLPHLLTTTGTAAGTTTGTAAREGHAS